MDPEQGFTRLTPRLNCDNRDNYESIHFANSRVLIIFNSRQNFRAAKLPESPRRSDKFQLRGSPITSIHRFFFFSLSPPRLQIPSDPSPSLFSRKNLRNIVASPRHCTGEHFSFFFFLRPGSFRKRALTRWNRWRQSLWCISPGQFRYYEISAGIVYQAWLAARNDAAAIVRTGRKRRARNDEHRRRSRAHRGCINASPRSRHAILGYLGRGKEAGGERRGWGRIYYGEAASCSILVYREFLKAVSWCLDMTAFRVNGERYVSLCLCFSLLVFPLDEKRRKHEMRG